MRGQLTTRNISAALKLAREQLNAAAEIAYDRKTGSWTAWMLGDDCCTQVGLGGQGKDPLAAVEAMIENNKNNEE